MEQLKSVRAFTWRRAAFLLILTQICGCTTMGVVPPARDRQLMAQLASGTVVLDCSFTCSAAYIFDQREVWARYRAGDWHGLAIAVMHSGWRQDITYFLLALASQNLGYVQAADRYYRMAGYLATSARVSDRCASVSGICGPFSLPRDIYPRLAAVDRVMTAQRSTPPPTQRTDRPVWASSAASPPTSTYPAPRPAPSYQPANPVTPPVTVTDPKEDSWIDPPPVTR